jgi:hypothetical protein
VSEDLQLKTVVRLEPTPLESMGDLQKGDLFTLLGGPFEDGKDIYQANGDAFPEQPPGNHGIPAVQVGRCGAVSRPGLQTVKVTVALTMEDGQEETLEYEISPNTFNLAESLDKASRRVMAVGDVL